MSDSQYYAEEMCTPDRGHTSDPWKHRASGMRCKTCMWFVQKCPEGKAEDAPWNKRIGRCRRHAPTMSGYPVVFVNDWCGDHKLDEEKI